MKLFLSPDRPDLKWCVAADGVLSESSGPYGPGVRGDILEYIKDMGEPEAVGYMLFHGGEALKETVSPVTDEVLAKAEKSERFLPEDNTITTGMLKLFMKKYPRSRHYLFCDTAFFTKLPKEASTYAVPYEFTKKGVRKYGSNGLCHDWACGKITAMPGCGGVKKIVSVFVGSRTNVAAVLEGRPVETSAGFTPVEGIPSLSGCGDIDPTIIFQLHSTGLKFGDINRILTNESGFSGLLGRKCLLGDIVGASVPSEFSGARDIYYYNVIKHIGYSMAVMGGADAIAISCENTETAWTFAKTLCGRLEYPPLTLRKKTALAGGVHEVTGAGSGLKVFIAGYNPWLIMDEKTSI